MLEDGATTPIVIQRNAVDGAEIAYFKIIAISNGTLYQSGTQIALNEFITADQAANGVVYKPDANIFGTGSFGVLSSPAIDSPANQQSQSATSTITIDPVADTPTVEDKTTDEDVLSEGIVITWNALDLDGTGVTHYQITDITNGMLYEIDGTTAITSGNYITAAEGTAGLRFKGVLNSDTDGGFDVQAAQNSVVSPQSGVVHSTITVNAVADTPNLTANNITVSEGSSVQVSLVPLPSLNDNDGSESLGDVTISNLPSGSRMTVGTPASSDSSSWRVPYANVGNFSLVLPENHDEDVTASASITATEDRGVSSATATDQFTVNVTAVNDAPINSITPFSVDEDIQYFLANAGLAVSDVDAKQDTIRFTARVEHGTLRMTTTAGLSFISGQVNVQSPEIIVTGTLSNINLGISSLIYKGDLNRYGLDTLTVVTNDMGYTGGGALSDSDFVTITVNSVNDVPTATVITPFNSDEDQPIGSVNLNNYFADIEDEPSSFVYSLINFNPTLINPTLTDSILVLNAPANENGSGTLRVTARDLNGGEVNNDISITVNAINDTVVQVGTIPLHNTLEDAAPTVLADLDTIFSDLDTQFGQARQTLSYSVSSSDLSLLIANVTAGGEVGINLQQDQHGSARLRYTANDLNGSIKTDSVLITVAAVNDTPHVANFGRLSFTGSEDNTDTHNISGLFDDPDIATDSDSLVILVPTTDFGIFTVGQIGDILTITPTEDLSGVANVTIRATDIAGAVLEATLAVTINPVNDAPIFQPFNFPPDTTLYTDISGTKTVTFLIGAQDKDSDSLSIVLTDPGFSANISEQKPFESQLVSHSITRVLSEGVHTISLIMMDDGQGTDVQALGNTFYTNISVAKPVVSISGDQTFIVGNTLRALEAITLNNGVITSTLSPVNPLRLMLPPSSTLKWSLDYNPIFDALLIDSLEIDPSDPKQLIVAFKTYFVASESVEISHLAISGMTGTLTEKAIHISVDGGNDYAQANAASVNFIKVGNPSITLNDQILPVPDLMDSWPIGDITIANGAIAATIQAGDTLRLRLPDGLNTTWMPPTISSEAIVDLLGFESGNKIMRLIVEQDFSANEDIVLSGFDVVPVAPADTMSLLLDVTGIDPAGYGPSYPDVSGGKIGVVDAHFESTGKQEFRVGASVRSMADIYYWEDGNQSLIKSDGTLVLHMPYATGIKWAGNDLQLSVLGGTPETLSTTVNGDSTILTIAISPSILSAFSKTDTLLMSNINIYCDERTTVPASLECSATADGLLFHDSDVEMIIAGQSTARLSQSKNFPANGPATDIGRIIITEDELISTIDAGYGFDLVVPDALPASWALPDPSDLEIGGTYTGTIQSITRDHPKVLHFNISDAFIAAETIIIDSLKLEDFQTTSYVDNRIVLRVIEGEDIFPRNTIEMNGLSVVKIGKPKISMTKDLYVIEDNLGFVPMNRITIVEDSLAPVIAMNAKTLSIILPESLDIEWYKSIPIINISGTIPQSEISAIPHYFGNRVQFDIRGNSTIDANDSISIDGLYTESPTRFAEAPITLSLDGGVTVAAQSVHKIKIGRINFSSSSDQLFISGGDFLSRLLLPITIGQNSTVPLIGREPGFPNTAVITLRLPDSLMAYWDSVATTIDDINIPYPNGMSVVGLEFSNNLKDIYISCSPYVDSLRIENLYLSGKVGEQAALTESSQGRLIFILDKLKNTPAIPDSKLKKIGRPLISLSKGKNFVRGDTGIFAQLPDIIIEEDATSTLLGSYSHLDIEINGSLAWDTNITDVSLIFVDPDTSLESVTYYDNTVRVPISGLNLSVGEECKLSGLRFTSLSLADTVSSQWLAYSLIPSDGSGISLGSEISDANLLGVGAPTIHLQNNIDDLITDKITYPLSAIQITEGNIPVFGPDRAAIIGFDGDVDMIDWTINSQPVDGRIETIEVISNRRLAIYFSEKLVANDSITISGIGITTAPMFTGPGGGIIDAGSIGIDTLATSLALYHQDGSLGPITTIAASVDTTNIYLEPDMVFSDAMLYARGDSIILRFAVFPGTIPGFDGLDEHRSYFQLVMDDTTFDGPGILPSVVQPLYTSAFDVGETEIEISDMPELEIVFDDAALMQINSWYDKNQYYGESFNLMLDLDLDLLSAASIGLPKSLESLGMRKSVPISFRGFDDLGSIKFDDDRRVISLADYQNLGLILSSYTGDPLQFSLTGSELDTVFTALDKVVILSEYGPKILAEDLYTLRVNGTPGSDGIFPIIRQFIIDNESPKNVGVPDTIGTGRDYLPNRRPKEDLLVVELQDNTNIYSTVDSSYVSINESETQATVFPFDDLIQVSLSMTWGPPGTELRTDPLAVTKISRSRSGSASSYIFYRPYISLIDSIIGDPYEKPFPGAEELSLMVEMVFTDNADNETVVIDTTMIIWDLDGTFGDEVFNFPNPFSAIGDAGTKIRYILNEDHSDDQGKFLIMDAGGRIVYYKDDPPLTSGKHDIVWYGTNLRGMRLATGIYFGYLQVGDKKPRRLKIAIVNE